MLPDDEQLDLFDWAEERSFNERYYGFGGFDEYYTTTSDDITSDITTSDGDSEAV
jgi:hypothetical protein